MNTYMIGTRLTHSQMSDVVGGRIGRLNQSMASTLRKAAMDNGIKQTEQGLRLEFYTVDEEELDNLKNEHNDAYLALTKGVTVRPLVQFNKQKFSDKVDEINSKPEYRGGMKRDVYAKYERELRTAMAELCEVIGTDTNKRKKAETFTGTNPYKVGDYVWETGRSRDQTYQVTRVTAKTYTVAPLVLKQGVVSNKNYAMNCFNGTVNKRPDRDDHHGFFIPLKGNEDQFTLGKETTIRLGAECPWSSKDAPYNYKGCMWIAEESQIGYDCNDYWDYCD